MSFNYDKAFEKYTPTETAKKLKEMLFDALGAEDKDYVLSVLVDLKTDEQRQKMIKALENNLENYEFDDDDWNVYSDKVLLLTEAIAEGDV